MRSTRIFAVAILLAFCPWTALQAYMPIYTPKKTISQTDLLSGTYTASAMTVTGLTPTGGMTGYITYTTKRSGVTQTNTLGFYWDGAARTLTKINSSGSGPVLGSMVTCVSGNGMVAGVYWSADLDSQQLGFLWQNGTTASFQSPDGSDIDTVVAVNASGQVIGTYFGGAGLKRAFLWDGTNSTDLGDLGDPSHSFVWPQAINDAGQVIGTVYTPGEQGIGLVATAFQWQGGAFSALTGVEDYYGSNAVSVNSFGEITGIYSVPSSTQTNSLKSGGFYWFNDVLTDLGDLGGGSTAPFFINDDGVITGTAYERGNLLRLFSWQAGILGDLGAANLDPSDQSFEVTGANRLGDVTGFATNASGVDQAFLRTLGNNYNLAALVPGSAGFAADGSNGTRLLINDGQLIAASGVEQGVKVAVLLTPDFDGNGLPDGWEQYYFGHYPVDPTTPLAWNSSLTTLQAYQQGLNPVDYYNGQAPTMAKVSGDGQHGAPGEFVPLPLIVSVTANGQSLTNAPVKFSVTQGDGQVQQSSNSTPAQSLTVLTDYTGQAKVFFKLSSGTDDTNQITATPGSGRYAAAQTCTEYADAIPSGNPSPFAPANLISRGNPDGSIDMSWTNNTDDQTPVEIEFQQADGSWRLVETLPPCSSSYHYVPGQ